MAPRCVIHNDYQLRLLVARAASRRRIGTVTPVDTAFAGACLALALAGLTATAAVTLGAASVVDADRRSTKRDDGKGRPEEKTFHRRFSIPKGTELRDDIPQHTVWAGTSPPACHEAKRRAASDSVPPNPVQDAGRAIWNGLSSRESQTRQLC